ncbi:MAG: hypothetical protein GWO02_07430 [Gammaproteobacteria bacterium]|nr:hypothetical protein [Gammaproteobacteria bacterium]
MDKITLLIVVLVTFLAAGVVRADDLDVTMRVVEDPGAGAGEVMRTIPLPDTASGSAQEHSRHGDGASDGTDGEAPVPGDGPAFGEWVSGQTPADGDLSGREFGEMVSGQASSRAAGHGRGRFEQGRPEDPGAPGGQ